MALTVSFLFPSTLFADGSRDFYPVGAKGNRAFLYCNLNTTSSDSWPFKTTGTHYVYARAGETIAAASSAQGYAAGTIILVDPNGIEYDSGTGTSNQIYGFIKNRTQELAGPHNGTGPDNNRYKPFEKDVTAATEGVWRVEFLPPAGKDGTTNIEVPGIFATANWTQSSSGNGANVIAAWDVSVRNGINWIPGRCYTNVLNLHLKGEFSSDVGFYATNYVLTKDGRAYRVQTNGSNGIGFTFFSNSNGFSSNSLPTYKSLDVSTKAGISPFTHDPRTPDNGNNVTHKIFYTKPAKDLPALAPVFLQNSSTETWLKNTVVLPRISDVLVTGLEGTVGQVSRKGANITFNSTTGGTFKINIPVPAGVDRTIEGVAVPGVNSVFWDGKDGSGNFVPAGNTLSEIKTRLLSAEVHFPYIDMEINPQGIIIELTDNTLDYNLITDSPDESVYSSKVYWDDSDVSGAGTLSESSSPVVNKINGLSSITNGHKWGAYKSTSGSGNSGSGNNSFGNTKSMDTWAYIQGNEESQPINAVIIDADLEVQSITPTATSYFSANEVTYTIRVKNNGPSDVQNSTFAFKAPAGFEISGVISSVVNGTVTNKVPLTSADKSSYTSKLDMSNGGVIEFVITGKVGSALVNKPLLVEASIMRPPDVTDPDATNPDPAILTPSDPHVECLNGGTVETCNNIKYNTINAQDLCLNAPLVPVVHILSGGTPQAQITGTLPGGLTSNSSGGSVTISGSPQASGIFTIGSQADNTSKTTVLINVRPNPVIQKNPDNLIVCEGADANVTVVSSEATDTYRWEYQESGEWKTPAETSGISGINSATLNLTNISSDLNNIKFRVVVTSNLGCSTISPERLITVNPLPPTSIVTASGSTAFCIGGQVVLTSSSATGNQWYKDGVLIAGAVQQNYTAIESGSYTVIVTDGNTCSSQASASTVVTVNPLPPTPVITAGSSTVFCIGGQVVLTSSSATGNQWYKDGILIADAIQQNYTAIESGSYAVIVTDGNTCSSLASASTVVTVNPLPPTPAITAGSSTVFCIGGQVVLTSSSATGNQWYKDGVLIAGAIQQNYTAIESGSYTVIVTDENTCSSQASASTVVTVNPLPPTPVITAGSSTVFCIGGQVVLTSSSATGNQWYKDGILIDAIQQNYTAIESGNYTVKVTDGNACSSPVSAATIVTVNPLPPIPMVTAVSSTEFCIGGQVTLASSSASGNQWYKDGNLITGATQQNYIAKESGKYAVIVTDINSCPSPVSAAKVVTVNPLPSIPTVTTAGSTEFCIGGQVVLTSSSVNGNQWYKDGNLITGATQQNYTASESGNYTVIVTDGNTCSSPASAAIVVTVNPLPSTPAVTATGNTIFCIGGQVILTSSSATGNQWYKNGTLISGANLQTYTAIESGSYTVIVTDWKLCSSPVSTAKVVTVNPLPPTPVITASGSTTFCIGGQVVLTSGSATGNQWYKNGGLIPGATQQNYTAIESGSYTVIVTDGNTCSSSPSAATVVTINPLPPAPIVTVSGSTTFCTGGEVVLNSSSVSGNQWYKNGSLITGATQQKYTATEPGNYTVVVTDGNVCSSPVSSEIIVTVNPLPPTPAITAAGSTAFCIGGQVELNSSSATGNQWYKDGVLISGATSQKYTATESGNYKVIVTDVNSCPSQASAGIGITVNPLPPTPVIIASGSTTFCIGGQVVLTSSSASGNQWYKNGGLITGANQQNYIATESGNYTVIVTDGNSCSSPASAAIIVTVNPLPPTPAIAAAGSTTFCAGGQVVLTSSSAAGNQWYRDGSLISGATSQTYTAMESGNYTVIVTDGNTCSSPASAGSMVRVNPLPLTPSIATSGSTTFCTGGQVELTSSSASGNQWYKDGVLISGATSQTYTATESGNYTVIATDGNICSSQVSAAIIVIVNPLPPAPAITAAGNTTFCLGEEVVLTSSSATGNQWYKDGLPIPGATQRTYRVTQSGEYTVIVIDGNICSGPASAATRVTVNPLPAIPIVSATGSTTFCTGGQVVLTSNSGSGNQWFKNGILISGATQQTFIAVEPGNYSVIVTDGNVCSSPLSAPMVVTVNPLPPPPVITASGSTTFCIGGQVILTSSSATGNQWYKNGSLITGASQQNYIATESGSYTLIVTDGNSCSSPASAASIITVNPLPPAPAITATSSTIFCTGSQVVLTSSSAAGNQWYRNGSLITGAIQQAYTATESGNYTVIVTDGNICSSPASAAFPVTVNLLPPTPTITAASSTTFCTGSKVVLTSSSAMGNQWYRNGILISGAVSQTYTATESGNYSVIVTDGNTCPSPVSAGIVITVHPLPAVPIITVSGSTTFCIGGQVILTSSSASGNQWYKNGVLIQGAVRQTYTATGAGNYTVIVTDGNVCSSPVSAGTIITVNPLPPTPVITASSATEFCIGGQVVLTSSSAGGNQWYKNGVLIPNAILPNYTATESGSYFVIVRNNNGCTSQPSAAQPVVVSTFPVQPEISPAGITSFCEGGTVALTSSAESGNQWYKNGVKIPGANLKTYNAAEIGTYSVKVTNSAGCESVASRTTLVNVTTLPKGFDDRISFQNCSQSSFNYDLQANVNNITKGGNGVKAMFRWTVASKVSGATNGTGSSINTNLINTTIYEQDVIYTVTPISETGGCQGKPFKITVHLPVCLDLSITKTADRAYVSNVGDKINYTISIFNSGSANHTNLLVNDPLVGGNLSSFSGDNGNGILEKDETWVYKATYSILQSDLDNNGLPVMNNGKIINTAFVKSTEIPVLKSASAEVQVRTNPAIRLLKTGVVSRDFNMITYSFRIINKGNVTLQDIKLTDKKIQGTITLNPAVLAPGQSTTIRVSYTITNAEKISGNVRNTALVTGLTKTGTTVTDISGLTENDDNPTDIDVTKYPAAVDDYATTKTDIQIPVPIIKNDHASFFPLDIGTIEIKTQPSNGTLVVLEDGMVIYTPNLGYYGIEMFTYMIKDSVGLASNEAVVTIKVTPPELEVPNTFTPNGDGKNDTFKIKGKENYDAVEIYIYNRWGDEVYRNMNYKDEWDGANLNEGTYFYVLKMKKDGVEESKRSWVLLKR